ncbi:MAG: DUF222 domain-containing protein [Thermodesulfobacteriota bacterium]
MTPTAHAANRVPQLRSAAADELANEIAEVASHIDAATHRLLTLIRRFDEGGGWAVHGALSCAHWLNWRIGLDLGAARERVRVARALGSLPVLDDALRRGIVSYSKIRAMTRVADADNEASLLEMARHATASQLEKICRGYRRALTSLEPRPESLGEEELRRFVRVRDALDGMVCVEARLRPDEAAVVLRALDAARRLAWRAGGTVANRDRHQRGDADAITPSPAADVSAETRTTTTVQAPQSRHEPHPPLARADALVAVAEAYLRRPTAHPDDATTRAAAGAAPAPVELVVHVDEATLLAEPRDDGQPTSAEHHATLDDGTALSVATAQRLACDATIVRVQETADGNVRTLARRTRCISKALHRALRLHDDACRFPGCTNRITDAHHIRHWAHGGATKLDNLCLLCRRHHRLVHEHGYRIERSSSSGELTFLRSDGSRLPTAQPHRPLDDDAYARLADTHEARGLHLDAHTAFPRWDGEPVDYDAVVHALVHRARCSPAQAEAPTQT